MAKGDEFLRKREVENEKAAPSDAAEFAYFSPMGERKERFKFLVLKEDGADVSILPDQGRFKKGLRAWRWEEAEGGDPTSYLVLKTKSNRIDMRRLES